MKERLAARCSSFAAPGLRKRIAASGRGAVRIVKRIAFVIQDIMIAAATAETGACGSMSTLKSAVLVERRWKVTLRHTLSPQP
ncbi:MAG: hypothetical protein CFE29_31585 [Bradyrhizobiaceae bacterium PARB1]|jgi:hypothetical protein|nr:MAG: hypothetical protein CFE29_31585 [Bradyrhizobiaceae bacterium PARB1]